MDVKYITVTRNNLPTIPIIDGQIIALMDQDAWFYDMYGQRRYVSGHKVYSELPEDTSSLFKDTLVVVSQGDDAGVYWWDGKEFHLICNVNSDENVTSESTDSAKYYLTGSLDKKDSTSHLLKRDDVYVDSEGIVHAEGFAGGSAANAENAENAESADQATADSLGQPIAETYIKKIETHGTEVVITYGNNETDKVQTQDTDTHYVSQVVITNSNESKGNAVATNGFAHINLIEDNKVRSSHLIKGSGSVLVETDKDGNLEVKGQDTWKPNTRAQEGFVPKGVPNKIWATDSEGNPEWRDNITPYIHPESSADVGSYTKVTIDSKGHVVAGSNPDTLQGMGITDGVPYSVLPNNADLDKILKSGFYIGAAGNSITHKPENVNNFGLIVIEQTTTGTVTQKLFASKQYTRISNGGVFGSGWTEDKLTDTVYTHPQDPGAIHIPPGGSTGQILVWNGDGRAQWGDPQQMSVPVMTGSTSSTRGKSGLVPAPEAGPANMYLRNDGTWASPPSASVMVGASSTGPGSSGVVPAPQSGDSEKFLKGDGTWAVVPSSSSDAGVEWEKFPAQ